MARNVFNSNHGIAIDWRNDTGAAVESGDIVVMGGGLTATLALAFGDIPDGEDGVLMVKIGRAHV